MKPVLLQRVIEISEAHARADRRHPVLDRYGGHRRDVDDDALRRRTTGDRVTAAGSLSAGRSASRTRSWLRHPRGLAEDDGLWPDILESRHRRLSAPSRSRARPTGSRHPATASCSGSQSVTASGADKDGGRRRRDRSDQGHCDPTDPAERTLSSRATESALRDQIDQRDRIVEACQSSACPTRLGDPGAGGRLGSRSCS